MSDPRVVTVGLGARAYDILIGPGLIDTAGRLIAARFPGARVAVVTDANVARLHGPALGASLVCQCGALFGGSAAATCSPGRPQGVSSLNLGR